MTWLKPKQDNFFEHFDSLASVLLKVGEELQGIEVGFPSNIQHLANRCRELEHEADNITHNIIAEINKSFITPIDREDLHMLAVKIDSVIDYTENAISNLEIYDLREIRDPFGEYCRLIVRTLKEVAYAIRELRHLQSSSNATKYIIEINNLESEGDQLLRRALQGLFRNENDPIMIMKWKDVFIAFEHAFDRAEDVADVMEGISIKNS